MSSRINSFITRSAWDSIILTLKPLIKKKPADHWLLSVIASAYYEKKDYETAYRLITDAFVQKPDCPLVLWHMASIFRMNEKKEDAIIIWEEIIKRGAEEIAYDECGEGLAWARSLVNDSKYMISKTYKELGDVKQAKSFKSAYKRGISKGIKTIYDSSTL